MKKVLILLSSSALIGSSVFAAPDFQPQPSIQMPTQCAVPITMDIPMTSVSDIGNPPDQNSRGSVNYPYEISITEITNAQYAVFLNKAAGSSDPYQLFDSRMETSLHGGIQRVAIVSQGRTGYCYRAKTNFAQKPVNYVSWMSAVRFVNWLENGQRFSSPQDRVTEYGSYDLRGELNHAPYDVNHFYIHGARSDASQWVLPSENEWYKAAYYDPTNSDPLSPNGYWEFATRSNLDPVGLVADAFGNLLNPVFNAINFNLRANWNGSTEGNVSTVGSATFVDQNGVIQNNSYYGTVDQNGNVAEFQENLGCWEDPREGNEGITWCGHANTGGSFADEARESHDHGCDPDSDTCSYQPNPVRLQMFPLSQFSELPYAIGGGYFRKEWLGFRVVRKN